MIPIRTPAFVLIDALDPLRSGNMLATDAFFFLVGFISPSIAGKVFLGAIVALFSLFVSSVGNLFL